MPEGPELRWMSEFVNQHAAGHHFLAISKSALATKESKHPVIQLPACWKAGFEITAEARGKEMRVHLAPKRPKPSEKPRGKLRAPSSDVDPAETITILFRCGMSGNFILKSPEEDYHKHAHLRFERDDGAAICFSDYRRFGSWAVTGEWGPPSERGPDIIADYPGFLRNLGESLDKAAFNKPIGEVLLDQRYFNGVGNYLRAEILHRARIHPQSSARAFLAPALAASTAGDSVHPPLPPPLNVLQLTQKVMLESLDILREHGFTDDEERKDVFFDWLQCYSKLSHYKDSLGRTMWFDPTLRASQSAGEAQLPKKARARAAAQPAEDAAADAADAAAAPPAKKRRSAAGKTGNSASAPAVGTKSRHFSATAASGKRKKPVGPSSAAQTGEPCKSSHFSSADTAALPEKRVRTRTSDRLAAGARA